MSALSWLPWAHHGWWLAVLARSERAPATWLTPDDGAATDPAPLTVGPLTVGPLTATWAVWVPLAVALLAVAVPPLWRVVRIGVTYVHELGHAGVGILMGRRFTGFVVRADMSGHAVTVGKPRGPGLALTTWAGYPAPAIAATGLVALSLAGWAPLVLGVVGVVAVMCLPFVRSWTTAGVTLVVAAGAGALWWWRSDDRSAAVLLAVAAVLLLGAWRHWAAVAGSPRGSDPEVLARQTGWPGWFWVGTQLLAIAAATAAAAWLLARALT